MTRFGLSFCDHRSRTCPLHARVYSLAASLLLLVTTLFAQSPPQTPPSPPNQQSPSAPAQAGTSDEGGADSDPIKVILLQVRSEYLKLNDDNWAESIIVRGDRLFLRRNRWGGKVGVLTRFDIPFVTVRAGHSTHAGLGDVYGQGAFAPLLTSHFALVVGSGVLLPTATYRTLGSGKWSVAPLGGPVYLFGGGRGFAYIKFQEFISVAGNSNRPDLRYVLVTPTLLWRFKSTMWLLVREESHTDLASRGGTWYTSGVQIGRIFNRKFAVWIMPEFVWGGTRPGNFNLKASVVWNRR